MDCNVAAAFDHVPHHDIIKATLERRVPPVLIAAWIREYRNSETIVKLDDIVTPGIRRTRSVCGSWQTAEKFMEMCQENKRSTCGRTWDFSFSRTTAGLLACH